MSSNIPYTNTRTRYKGGQCWVQTPAGFLRAKKVTRDIVTSKQAGVVGLIDQAFATSFLLQQIFAVFGSEQV